MPDSMCGCFQLNKVITSYLNGFRVNSTEGQQSCSSELLSLGVGCSSRDGVARLDGLYSTMDVFYSLRQGDTKDE